MHRAPIFLVVLLGTAGCLTTPASETGWTKRVRQAVPRMCGDDALIDDAEDNNSRIATRGGRGGYWYTSIDPAGSTMEPVGNFTMGSPGRAGSQHAARIHGQMASSGDSVYASMGFGLMDPQGPYDASRYAGITFWAKGPAHVRFEVPDAYTAPAGGNCKDCYNDFGIELAFTADWDRYTIPFEWLAQRQGWGDPRAEIAKSELFAVEWQFGTPGRSFDIWVDDIAFFCSPEGSAP
jgi:endoglucanase